MHSARFGISTALVIALGVAAFDAQAAGVAPSAATRAQKDEAQSRFLRGKELYGQSKFDAALAEFTASVDAVNSPNSRLYVARCLREMGKATQAYAEYGRTIADAKDLSKSDPRYEKAAEAAAEERKALEAKIGLVEVTVAHAAADTTLKVGGEDVRRDAWSEPIAVQPGSADVVVESPGKPAIKKTVNVSAGAKESVAIDAEAGSEEPPKKEVVEVSTPSDRAGLRPYAYVAGGVALAGLATFTVAGLLANGTYSDLEQACGQKACPPGHEDDISSGKTQQTIANVGLVFVGVGAVAAVTLWVLSSPKSSTTTAKVVTRGTYVGLEGSF